MTDNSDNIGVYFVWFVVFILGCVLVYWIIKALTQPSIIWFIVGVITTLAIEGLIILARRFFKRFKNTK